MAEKTLNTRIVLKTDTLENWQKSTLPIMKGEICLATVAASAGTNLTEPVVMIKVGEDGVKTFKDLDWNVYAKASDVLAACKSEESLTTFVNTVITNAKLATSADLTALTGRVDTAEGDITTLKGLVGSTAVATQIANAIDTLDLANTYEAKGEAAKVQTALETYKGTNDVAVKANTDAIAAIKDDENIDSFADVVAELAKKQNTGDYATKAEAQGYADAKDEAIAAAKKAGDDAMEEAGKKVASVTAGNASVTVGGTSVAPTVAAKLSADADNALTLVEDGLKVVIPSAAEYSIVKADDPGEFAAVYNLTKGGTIVGASINIPKDIVVRSGSVVGDEIVLVLNDEESTEIKIPVGSLIEYVTSGSETGDMVFITVDETTHKVTATITDGTITAAKLTTELQTAIGKAHAHENADVLAGINADKVAAWDGAEQNAKDYADGLNTAMDTRVGGLETKVGNDTVENQINAAIEALKIGDYAKAADLTAAVARIAQNETDIDALETAIAGKTNDADLATVAKSGLIDDLSVGEGTVLVFDCGTSA